MHAAIKYLFNTSWETKCCDWREYRALRDRVRRLRRDARVCYGRLVSDFGYIGLDNDAYNRMRRTPACVKTYSVDGVRAISTYDDSDTLVPMFDECNRFNPGGVDAKWCDNYNCPCICNNHKYHLAALTYAQNKKVADEFWGRKFANVK